ncbi:MAG: DUF6036 family nucleotidyltransferase [Candidatus Aminicenantales bacterium]
MKASYFSPDIREFIRLLAVHGVKYVIVGGEAVIYHGYARVSNNVDFFYELSPENVRNLYQALEYYWAGDIPGIRSQEDLSIQGATIQFGDNPNMIVLYNSLTGVSFEEAWSARVEESIRVKGKKCPVYFIGLEQLIRNKRALKRQKDRVDLKYLRAQLKKS